MLPVTPARTTRQSRPRQLHCSWCCASARRRINGRRPLCTIGALGEGISRDPIGERASLSLYGFVGNDPLIHYDRLGLFSKNYQEPIVIPPPLPPPPGADCVEAMGRDGKPRMTFDPAPPNGGWKAAALNYSTQGSAQAQQIHTITITWEARVAVLCKCKSCYKIRHGVRSHKDSEAGAWLVADPTSLPSSPFPVETDYLKIIGGLLGDQLLGNFQTLIPASVGEMREIQKAVSILVGRRPTKPNQGDWKDIISPCPVFE